MLASEFKDGGATVDFRMSYGDLENLARVCVEMTRVRGGELVLRNERECFVKCSYVYAGC